MYGTGLARSWTLKRSNLLTLRLFWVSKLFSNYKHAQCTFFSSCCIIIMLYDVYAIMDVIIMRQTYYY